MHTLILILGIVLLCKSLKKGGGLVSALLGFLFLRHFRRNGK